jgi:N-acetylmuramoyl-L-alanine amidase
MTRARLVLAVVAVAGTVVAVQAGSATPAPSPAAPEAAAAAKPAIKKKRIPYGRERKADMAAYSRRHYGEDTFLLTAPKQIVQHFSVSSSAQAVFNTFAPNRPDPELHELPGVCSHYVISPKGVIWELVPVTIRCRHVIGLNHVSIGIEHVGHSDGEVMGRKPQLRASLRLTRWLRCRFGISVENVIGHAESLGSPFYKELVPDARGRTHGDFKAGTMRRYRARLAALGGC